MTSGQIVGKMDTQKQLNVPLEIQSTFGKRLWGDIKTANSKYPQWRNFTDRPLPPKVDLNFEEGGQMIKN